MNLNLLRLFVIVAEATTFSEAARKVRLPRSSVSRGVAELERSLGVQLFNRTTRQVALTTAGAALYTRVGPQLADLQKSLGTLPERDEKPSGSLRLTAPTDMGVSFLPEVLAGFGLRYPGVSIEVQLSSRLTDLVGEGFDFALRVATKRLADSSLIARRLCDVAIELFGAPTYLARAGTPRSPEDTAGHDWITFRGQPPPPPFPKPERPARLGGDDMLFVYEAVRAGSGLALLPSFLAVDDVSAGRLVRLLPRHVLRVGTLYFVHPKAHSVPRKVTAFREYLVAYLASHPLSPRPG